MKKLYSKPQMFRESFAISEHFATGGSGCEEPVHSESACMENFYFGPGMQGYNALVPSCTYDMGCYHVPDGTKESAFYS